MTTVNLRGHYQITLPPEVRQALHVEVGDRLEFQIGDDGSVYVRGLKTILADQAWVGTPEWQAMEREADAALAAGNYTRVHSEEEMDAYFNALGAPAGAH